MRKIDFLPQDEGQCEKMFGVIKFITFLVVIGVLVLTLFSIIHWIWSVLAVFFYVWNIGQYQIGCFGKIANEYDERKFNPREGLHRMYQSWKVFAIFIAFAIIWLITRPAGA